MIINTETIKQLKPCQDRFDNWLTHYDKRSLTVRQFLALDKITHQDKLWVVLRLVDHDTKVIFALDCAFAAYAAADAAAAYAYAADTADAAAAYAADTADANAAYAYAANAAYAAAAYAANAADAYAAERARQLEALLYLMEGDK